MNLYAELFYESAYDEIFSDTNFVSFLLKTESALAQAQAQAGIISLQNAQIISKCCRPEIIAIEQLKNETKLGGNAAIPLVKQLTQFVKSQDFEASKFVHLGATSQDIVDTATVLQIHQFLELLENSLVLLKHKIYKITLKHKNTVMAGRTLLQQAKPITFGLKTSTWLESLNRSSERIRQLKERILVVQLGGAVGSQNSNLNADVVQNFAEILKLKFSFSWQSQRDNFNELASKLGILGGTLGKIAKDVSLLMQTEIGEVCESAAEGKGGSSTMPHKRNPVTCTAILANANRLPHLVASMLSAMLQENERSAGNWHAEWEVLTDIMRLTGASVEKTIDLISGLEINEKQMLANIELTKGLIFAENVTLALADKMGKIQAHELMEKACKQAISKQMHLKEVLLEMNLGLPNLEAYFIPENSIGNSIAIVEAILDAQNLENL